MRNIYYSVSSGFNFDLGNAFLAMVTVKTAACNPPISISILSFSILHRPEQYRQLSIPNSEFCKGYNDGMILGQAGWKGYGYRDFSGDSPFAGATDTLVKSDTAIAPASGAYGPGGHHYPGVSAGLRLISGQGHFKVRL